MAQASSGARQITGPLESLEDWDDDLKRRYPETGRTSDTYRNYEKPARASVREFYRLNHLHQTLDFVLAKKAEYLPPRRKQMGIWEAMEFLNTLVDDSDPDTDLSQIEHLIQVAEAMRRDGQPRWFILTGLIHDLGKILCLWGEPQWAVVGDTFPVGCAFSDKVVYPEFFASNPDFQNPDLQTLCGIYEPQCGLARVHLSWGHDEYLYQVTKDYLPAEALAMIRYHSFYAAHREGAYKHLMNERDLELMKWVRAFNPYDLYTKGGAKPDVAGLRPYYESLIAEYFPPMLPW
jgi:inositol oxygenase